jgi:hypothetical protein
VQPAAIASSEECASESEHGRLRHDGGVKSEGLVEYVWGKPSSAVSNQTFTSRLTTLGLVRYHQRRT